MNKTLSPTWFPLGSSFSLSLHVLAHILSQVFLCGVICFYHSASAAVPCHDYFAWFSLLARLLGDRPLGNTWLGANHGVCAPVRERGGLREVRGGKSIIFKARGLSSFMKGPVIHPFFIPSGSYCVFSCQWACDRAAVGDGRAADQGVSTTEKPLLLSAHRGSQDRGITLQTAKKPLLQNCTCRFILRLWKHKRLYFHLHGLLVFIWQLQ